MLELLNLFCRHRGSLKSKFLNTTNGIMQIYGWLTIQGYHENMHLCNSVDRKA